MALQTTGQISLGDIANEKGVISLDFSLTNQSVFGINQVSRFKPDGDQPHSIGEFYGYDHNAKLDPVIRLKSFSSSETMLMARAFEACGLETRNTLYHNGSGDLPQEGDTVFTDSRGEEKAGWGATAFGENQAFEMENGMVVMVVSCGGPGGDKVIR